MARAHHALPDGFDHKLRALADQVAALDPMVMSEEALLHERNGIAFQLRRISRWPRP